MYFSLVISTSCLPLATLHAQTMEAENSAVFYNNQGNIASDSQSSEYRYNRLNQLTYDQAIKSKKTINYQYYATGMQASEAIAPGSHNMLSTTFHHYYAGQGQLLNSMQKNKFSGYLLAHGMAIRSYQSTTSPQAQVYVRNRHSSVITMIGKKTTKTQQYNAYGETILNGKSSLSKTAEAYGINISPLGYSNYPLDNAAGIYYLKARYYTSIYRTFLSRDSYNLSNHYLYSKANPVNQIDSSGHWSFDFGEIASKLKFWEKPEAMRESESEESLFLLDKNIEKKYSKPTKKHTIPEVAILVQEKLDHNHELIKTVKGVIKNRFDVHNDTLEYDDTTYLVERMSADELDNRLWNSKAPEERNLHRILFTRNPEDPYTTNMKKAISAFRRGPEAWKKWVAMGLGGGVVMYASVLGVTLFVVCVDAKCKFKT